MGIATTLSAGTEDLQLRSVTLGALPIVNHFLARMGVARLLERYLPEPDRRAALSAARAIGVLVRNLCVRHEPVYRLGEWAGEFDPAVLGLAPGEVELLNDDRVGRALERLFLADRGSFLTELMLGVIDAFELDCSQLHNDSTSVSLHGAYPDGDGRAHHGKATVALLHGHSKDRRPDLKQLVWILTVAADEAVPVSFRLADGNTNDDLTHVQSWETLRALCGRSDFLYVADSKLCTRPSLTHIDQHGGRFITILPRTRKEDRRLRAWLADGQQPDWSDAARQSAQRHEQPEELWRTAPAPIPSAEGYRIILVHSTTEHRRDEHLRSERLARAQAALTTLNQRLHGPKCRFAERDSVQAAIDAILTQHNTTTLLRTEITDRGEEPIVSCTRRADGSIYRKRETRQRFAVSWQPDPHALAHDRATDGIYPLITNDHTLTDPEILAAYRYQPHLEKRHHQLKTLQHATPVYLKTPARIEALFLCHYIALLTNALIERHLRHAMQHQHINQLPLYPEHRHCTKPTAHRTLELFTPLTRHHLSHHDQHLRTFPPTLTPLQTQLLHLLNIPTTTYQQ